MLIKNNKLDDMKKYTSNINRSCLLYLVVFIMLFWGFFTNAYKCVGEEQFYYFQRDSDNLTLGRVIGDPSKDDKTFFLGMYTSGDENVFITNYDLYANDQDPADLEYVPYYQQLGLQGDIYRLIDKILPTSNAANIVLFEMLNCALLAGVLLCLLHWVKNEFGTISFVLCFFSLFYNPWLTMGAGSIYWCFWIYFTSLVVNLFILSKEYNEKTKLQLLSLSVFVFTLLKCASGYEFVTVILICGELPLFYYAIKEKWNFKKFFMYFSATSVIAVMGFVSGIFLHVLKGIFTNHYTDVVRAILGSMSYRLGLGNTEALSDVLKESLNVSYHDLLKTYLTGGTIDIVFNQNMLSLICIGIFSFLVALTSVKNMLNDAKIRSLTMLVVISLLAPLSWIVLAKGHSYIHTHINYILWSIPTVPILFAGIGCYIKVCADSYINKCVSAMNN